MIIYYKQSKEMHTVESKVCLPSMVLGKALWEDPRQGLVLFLKKFDCLV